MTPHKLEIGFILPLLAATLLAHAALAQSSNLYIEEGVAEPIPIAISPFEANDQRAISVARDVVSVVKADLERSGLFKAIDENAFIQTGLGFSTVPRYADWKVINADALVTGAAEIGADGLLAVKFRLWDVFGEQPVDGFVMRATTDSWRRIAHKVSDFIYQKLTGDPGYFDTRVVYVAENGPKNGRTKRLAIMDYDGANHSFLTNGSSLVLTPRFSPEADVITFLSYEQGRPLVYLYNIITRRKEVLGNFPGMSFAPSFSPDGELVVMSLASSGNSDIYKMDLRTRRKARLTDHPAIDTSPSFSPDARQIVFNSDRGGSQQLYVMNADGSGVNRISFGKGRYATPVWSPRGDLISFTKLSGGRFSIGVMEPDGSNERIMTESFLDEGPTWAPNGRSLMFFRQQSGARGRTQLWSIDLTGRNLRPVPTPQDASDPSWSPTLN